MAEQKSRPAPKATLSDADIKARKEALKNKVTAPKVPEPKEENSVDLQAENEKLLQQIEEMKAQAARESQLKNVAVDAVDPNAVLISELSSKVKMLSDMVTLQQRTIADGKPQYRPVPPEDYQDEPVTFSSRRVFYVIGSYLDHRGVEIMPPYKLITLRYASSDRRKEGHEESIVNYCTFTTHLKGEIEFLRNHPLCSVEFFENVNQTMKADGIYAEFRAKAANQVIGMKDESVINNCHRRGIANVNTLGIKDLRRLLASSIAEEYITEAKLLKDDQDRRKLLGQPISE